MRTVCRTQSGTSARGISRDRAARLQHELGDEPLEVGQDEQVGLVAGRDGAEVARPCQSAGFSVAQTSASSGGIADRDRVADHRVDVSVVGDVLGLAVVGAERDPAGPYSASSGSSACRFRAADASRISSHIPARSRSRPSSAVYASWSERMPAAAYAFRSRPSDARRVAVDVRRRARASRARSRRRR